MDAEREPLDIYSIKHIRILRNFLWTIGAWPAEALGEHIPFIVWYHRKHLPVQTTIMLLGQINYLITRFKSLNFFILGHMYITSFLTALTVLRSSLPSLERYGELSKQFLMEFHLLHFKYKGGYYEKMYNIIDKLSYIFTLYLSAMMVLGLVLFNMSPLYNNITMGAFTNRNENMTLEFSVYYIFPGFDPVDHFLFTTVFNYYISFCCSVSICSIDLFLSLMIFQIIGHIFILRDNLKNLPKPPLRVIPDIIHKKLKVTINFEVYNIEENKVIHEKLVECINHHKFIVSFTDELSDFFGITLATYYLFHLVSGCLLLLECSTGDPNALARYGPLTIIIFGQLMQISIIFEIVGYVSEKLTDSVYYIPWESMSIGNQRTVSIFFLRVQEPIQVTAMGMTPVGVNTMAGYSSNAGNNLTRLTVRHPRDYTPTRYDWRFALKVTTLSQILGDTIILKTTFSYFTFLKSKS